MKKTIPCKEAFDYLGSIVTNEDTPQGSPDFLESLINALEKFTLATRLVWYRLLRKTQVYLPFPSFPDGTPRKYSVIYADPPWYYNDRRNTHTRFCGGAMVHYPTMKTQYICAIPIQEITNEDCFLFMWATWPNIMEAFKVAHAWGFRFSTIAFNWVKTNRLAKCDSCDRHTPFFGIGHVTKSNSESCLLFRKGSPKVKSNYLSSHLEADPVDEDIVIENEIIEAVRMAHSVKPEEARERIERLCGPDVQKIELFARRKDSKRWQYWGTGVVEDVTVDEASAEINEQYGPVFKSLADGERY